MSRDNAGGALQYRRILIVDDNRDSADSLASVVALWGGEAKTAYGYEEAISLTASFKPDAMLIDIGLPERSGYELAAEIQALTENDRPLLIAVSGYGGEEDRRRSIRAGFTYHLVKPTDLDALRELLSQR